MNILSSILVVLMFVVGSGFTSTALAAKSMKKTISLHSKSLRSSVRFDWLKLIGIGVDIKFGTNIPSCPCCYGGVCEIKIGASQMVNGPLNDDQVKSYADALLANDQGIVGVTQSGENYLIFNRRTTRPELQGSTLDIKADVRWDPVLSSVYGIPGLKAGKYVIIDNGMFKAIRLN